jgi:hypothetical protein
MNNSNFDPNHSSAPSTSNQGYPSIATSHPEYADQLTFHTPFNIKHETPSQSMSQGHHLQPLKIQRQDDSLYSQHQAYPPALSSPIFQEMDRSQMHAFPFDASQLYNPQVAAMMQPKYDHWASRSRNHPPTLNTPDSSSHLYSYSAVHSRDPSAPSTPRVTSPRTLPTTHDDMDSALKPYLAKEVVMRSQPNLLNQVTQYGTPEYLLFRSHLTTQHPSVFVFTAKVAQKSYGSEKRFICPPPSLLLVNIDSWITPPNAQYPAVPMAVFKVDNSASALLPYGSFQEGHIEWHPAPASTKDPNSTELCTSRTVGRFVARQLHVADTTHKLKSVSLTVELTSPHGVACGRYASAPIKVISKPSRKKMISKNVEGCIIHGGLVALFNRVRSQTVSTKYLGQDPATSTLLTRTTHWDPFVIYLVNPTEHVSTSDSRRNADPTKSPILIHFGQKVVLQCVHTGLVSPIMTLRRVENSSLVPASNSINGGDANAIGDPVCQLHKVAFELEPNQSPSGFLACLGESIGVRMSGPFMGTEELGLEPPSVAAQQEAASVNGTKQMFQDVTDASVWTIVSVNYTKQQLNTSPYSSSAVHPHQQQQHPVEHSIDSHSHEKLYTSPKNTSVAPSHHHELNPISEPYSSLPYNAPPPSSHHQYHQHQTQSSHHQHHHPW